MERTALPEFRRLCLGGFVSSREPVADTTG